MPTTLILQPTPEDTTLHLQREELTSTRALLAERELQVADLRTQLKTFEGRYLRQVGVLYADLDDWEARIAEREVSLYDSATATARDRAAEARRRATETHDAAFADAHDAEEIDPTPDLKRLFREVAKRIHPDFARDAEDAAHCTRLMARANQAYSRGDTDTLQRILDDHHETISIDGEDTAAELIRIARQIQHGRRDISAIDLELATLPSSEIAQLKYDADIAAVEGRDLLTELASSIRERIAEAQRRYEFLDRQIFAYGK
jgi:hypothetical protein